MHRRVSKVSVVGAGRMGHGLAQLFVTRGLDVSLIGRRSSTLESARRRIASNLRLLQEQGVYHGDPEQAARSIRCTTEHASGVSTADFVLETISEDAGAKKQVFELLDRSAPRHAILASNTSGLSITMLGAATSRPNLVIGCHWWNPPYLMPLVEVVPGQHTSQETLEDTLAFLRGIGKEPVVVRKEVPGFIWNRLQAAVLREAMHLAETGVASIEDIDKVVKRGYALRSLVVGPFETIDLSGLKLWQTLSANLFPALSNTKRPSRLFDERIRDGALGAEQGAGFYSYESRPFEEIMAARDRRLVNVLKCLGAEI